MSLELRGPCGKKAALIAELIHLFKFLDLGLVILPPLFFPGAFKQMLKNNLFTFSFFSSFFFFVFLLFLWAAPAAYGGSQARGRIGAVASHLHQSHSHAGSEPCLRPTPQLMATPDR